MILIFSVESSPRSCKRRAKVGLFVFMACEIGFWVVGMRGNICEAGIWVGLLLELTCNGSMSEKR